MIDAHEPAAHAPWSGASRRAPGTAGDGPVRPSVWPRRLREIALFACGIAFIVCLAVAVGTDSILASFHALSWRLLLVAAFPAMLLKLCDVLAWQCALPPRTVSFRRLGSALLSSQAVATSTLTGGVGADAAKVWLLRHDVSRRTNLSSLIIIETTSTASRGLFLLVGILLAQRTLASRTPLLRAMEWLLFLEAIGVTGFVVVQCGSVATRLHRLAERFRIPGAGRLRSLAMDLDHSLVAFYRDRRRDLALSCLWNFLGWVAGAAEVWLILYWLGMAVSASMALIIEAFGTGISFATFFVPVDLGVDEGGSVATFLALGLGGPAGLSLSLVRRVREATWVAIGLFLLMAGRRRTAAVPVPGA